MKLFREGFQNKTCTEKSKMIAITILRAIGLGGYMALFFYAIHAICEGMTPFTEDMAAETTLDATGTDGKTEVSVMGPHEEVYKHNYINSYYAILTSIGFFTGIPALDKAWKTFLPERFQKYNPFAILAWEEDEYRLQRNYITNYCDNIEKQCGGSKELNEVRILVEPLRKHVHETKQLKRSLTSARQLVLIILGIGLIPLFLVIFNAMVDTKCPGMMGYNTSLYVSYASYALAALVVLHGFYRTAYDPFNGRELEMDALEEERKQLVKDLRERNAKRNQSSGVERGSLLPMPVDPVMANHQSSQQPIRQSSEQTDGQSQANPQHLSEVTQNPTDGYPEMPTPTTESSQDQFRLGDDEDKTKLASSHKDDRVDKGDGTCPDAEEVVIFLEAVQEFEKNAPYNLVYKPGVWEPSREAMNGSGSNSSSTERGEGQSGTVNHNRQRTMPSRSMQGIPQMVINPAGFKPTAMPCNEYSEEEPPLPTLKRSSPPGTIFQKTCGRTRVFHPEKLDVEGLSDSTSSLSSNSSMTKFNEFTNSDVHEKSASEMIQNQKDEECAKESPFGRVCDARRRLARLHPELFHQL